ncbi:hypothetical protein SCHPADRAFT_934672 [Schizopora paradoxa]|uniref:MARVEL domain-containing protein n=1 Tax=Schizopora paradoxa TaxID=27342 RepID=A0A0H2S7X8_9AGAM|nr:hypothetical protein SCHPADRAFT_934672 [Schizopora paradoxa]
MGFSDSYVRKGHPILFGLIVFFSLVEGIIAAWLVARYLQHHNYPSIAVRDRARFLLFASSWTFFLFIFMIVAFKRFTDTPMASVGTHVALLGLTWIFWTAGAASITAALGGGYNCSTIDFLLVYCNQLVSLEAFAWTVWSLMTIALAVVLFTAIRARQRGDGFGGALA